MVRRRAWAVGLFCFLSVSAARGAVSLEGILAGNVEKIFSYQFTGGVSFRWRLLWKPEGFSPFLQSNWDSDILYSDWYGGVNYRTSGPFFVEAGAGLRYSPVFGLGLAASAGLGLNLDDKWYLVFPVLYKHNLWVEYTPYIGYHF